MKRPSKKVILDAIDDTIRQSRDFIPTGSPKDPMIFTYNRLISNGMMEDKALRMVSCAVLLIRMGLETKRGLPHEYIDAIYRSMPDSDPEIALLSMCG